MKKNIIGVALFMLIACSAQNLRAECFGNACEYITVTKRAGAIVILNSHPKKIIVVKRTDKKGKVIVGTTSAEVYAMSEEVPKDITGQTLSGGYNNYSANFK